MGTICLRTETDAWRITLQDSFFEIREVCSYFSLIFYVCSAVAIKFAKRQFFEEINYIQYKIFCRPIRGDAGYLHVYACHAVFLEIPG